MAIFHNSEVPHMCVEKMGKGGGEDGKGGGEDENGGEGRGARDEGGSYT